jgi:plasmid stabilization system protein ParE
MSGRLRIHPEAEAEFAEAIRWYEQHDAGLALDFANAVDDGMAAVQQAPRQYPAVYRDVRRCIIRRFPYGVFFVPGQNELQVLAIYHLSRDPRGWQSRR